MKTAKFTFFHYTVYKEFGSSVHSWFNSEERVHMHMYVHQLKECCD